MTTKSTAEHVKDAAHGKTDDHALSAAHKTERPSGSAGTAVDIPANDRAVNDLLKRVTKLEALIAHWHNIYQWPIPDDMVQPEPPPRTPQASD